MTLTDRFELLELLREDEVQTFRARERTTDRVVEAHLLESSGAAGRALLAKLDHLSEPQRRSVIDRGSHEGRLYVVTTPLAAGFREWLAAAPAPLDSAGTWRIRPSAPEAALVRSQPAAAPASTALPGPEPGDFTRMFELRQAPEPVATPASKGSVSKAMEPVLAATPQPGEFTRAFPRVFDRPATAPSTGPAGSPEPGQPGEFTKMFQKPAPPVAQPVPQAANSVPSLPRPASQPMGTGTAAPARKPAFVIIVAIVIFSAIIVFMLVRRLY